jgi:hypothetical protein
MIMEENRDNTLKDDDEEISIEERIISTDSGDPEVESLHGKYQRG